MEFRPVTDPDITHVEHAVVPVALVRFRRGVVGETKRVCHIVPLPTHHEIPDVLTAFCGTEIGPGQADILPRITGMPCEWCIARAPLVTGADPDALTDTSRPAIANDGAAWPGGSGGNPYEGK